jgi:hypothetical protein
MVFPEALKNPATILQMFNYINGKETSEIVTELRDVLFECIKHGKTITEEQEPVARELVKHAAALSEEKDLQLLKRKYS